MVYGEILTPGAKRTVVFYAHYDGQPLDPKEWKTPPWQPVLRDKSLEQDGQVIPLPPTGKPSIRSRASMRGRRPTTKRPSSRSLRRSMPCTPPSSPLKSNIKFVFEGEEEAGSQPPGPDPRRQ